MEGIIYHNLYNLHRQKHMPHSFILMSGPNVVTKKMFFYFSSTFEVATKIYNK